MFKCTDLDETLAQQSQNITLFKNETWSPRMTQRGVLLHQCVSQARLMIQSGVKEHKSVSQPRLRPKNVKHTNMTAIDHWLRKTSNDSTLLVEGVSHYKNLYNARIMLK